MLVTFLVAPFGAALAVLLPLFLIVESSKLPKLSVGYVIIFDCFFGTFSLFVISQILKWVYEGMKPSQILSQIIGLRDKLAEKRVFHVMISLAFVGIWIVSICNKLLYPETFLMTRFSVVMMFSTAYGAIVVNDRLGISKALWFAVALSIILYIVDWNLTRAVSMNAVKSCGGDSPAFIVFFFLLLYWNHFIVNIMILAVCGVTLYYNGFNADNCPRVSPYIDEQLMIKIVLFTIIGLTLVRMVVIKCWYPNCMQIPAMGAQA